MTAKAAFLQPGLFGAALAAARIARRRGAVRASKRAEAMSDMAAIGWLNSTAEVGVRGANRVLAGRGIGFMYHWPRSQHPTLQCEAVRSAGGHPLGLVVRISVRDGMAGARIEQPDGTVRHAALGRIAGASAARIEAVLCQCAGELIEQHIARQATPQPEPPKVGKLGSTHGDIGGARGAGHGAKT